MPFVQVTVTDSTPATTRSLIAEVIYDAMRATLSIPENDRFIAVSGRPPSDLFIDPAFMGMQRTSAFVAVYITLRRGRPVEVKQALYAELARLLQERAAIPPDDLFVVLAENDSPDWSFGRGEAQYVLNPPPARRA